MGEDPFDRSTGDTFADLKTADNESEHRLAVGRGDVAIPEERLQATLLAVLKDRTSPEWAPKSLCKTMVRIKAARCHSFRPSSDLPPIQYVMQDSWPLH